MKPLFVFSRFILQLSIPFLLAGFVHAQQADMKALDDADLAAVTGQEGVSVDIEFRINTDSNGAVLPGFANCQNTNLCNIGIQFNNRLNAGGEWLVLKDVSGSMLIKNLFLGGTFSPSAASVYADATRFYDSAGTICLPNGAAASAACAAAVLDKPALQLAFQSTEAVGGNYTVFEPDIQMHLKVGRAAVEYGAAGYSADARGSFTGFLISDTTQLRARADIDGRVHLSGF